MGINRATAEFDIKIRQQINDSGLPPCVIRLELINILRGEMAIVGPRPALWNQYDLIAARDAVKANDVRPGLTGWAQINGRDELPIPVKAGLDGEYVRRMSFAFDVRCILGTISSVARHEGVREGAQEADKHD